MKMKLGGVRECRRLRTVWGRPLCEDGPDRGAAGAGPWERPQARPTER